MRVLQGCWIPFSSNVYVPHSVLFPMDTDTQIPSGLPGLSYFELASVEREGEEGEEGERERKREGEERGRREGERGRGS